MLNPKQITIFGAFLRNPYAELTYKDIKGYAQEKSNSVLQRAVTVFLKENLLSKRNVGNNILYKVKLSNTNTLSYFDLALQLRLPKEAKRSIQTVREELATSFVSIAVFGSFAEGKQTKTSDLDIAVFVRSKEEKRPCELSLKAAANKALLTIDGHVFTRDEMLEMITNNEENLGKQIAKKHLAVYNPAIFYSIVDEGIKHGFNPVPQ